MSLHCQDGKGSGKYPQLKDGRGPTSEAAPYYLKVSAKAIDSVMDEIQGACTTADMWQVEKKISTCISHKRAKAYGALMEQHCFKSDLPTGKDGPGSGSSEMVEVEEEFCKSISDLISTVITEGAKVPGGHSVALMSNIIWLVPNLPLNLVLAPCIDLSLEKECNITLGDTPRLSQQVMVPRVPSPVHL